METSISEIELLVDSILTVKNRFTLESLKTNNKNIFEETIDPFVDKKRELQSLLTELVVNEFTPLASDTEQYIKLIYGTFDCALKIYKQKMNIDDKSIFFVYKGGNILRYIIYELMHELGGKVSDDIEKYYEDSFRKSDADFSIYINPNLVKYDIVYDDMNTLAYLIQVHIRKIFNKDLPKYFNYYRLSDVEKKTVLQKYLDKLNETNTVKNKLVGYDGKFNILVLDDIKVSTDNVDLRDVTYIQQPDFSIDYQKRNLRTVEKINLVSQNNTSMCISSNQTIEFMNGPNKIKFSLVRTKIIFNGYFSITKNCKLSDKIISLGGELIDVSIPHRYDHSIAQYFEHLDKNVSEYHIKSHNTDFVFKAPSLIYLIEDLEKILFIYQVYPWDDTKYAKRIKRVIFMYFCMLLTNMNLSYEEKIRYLTFIKDGIFTKLIEMLVLHKPKHDEIVESINIFLKTSSKYESTSAYPFKVLLEHLSKLLKTDYNVKQFQEYCQLIYENINVLITLFNTMLKQCNRKGINANDITQGSKLWGGLDMDKHKYLKYKSKYLNIKAQKN
jgi:hypothetical protein